MFSGGCAYCLDSPCTCSPDEVAIRAAPKAKLLEAYRNAKPEAFAASIPVSIQDEPIADVAAVGKACARAADLLVLQVFLAG